MTREEQIRKLAHDRFHREGELEIDPDAKISEGGWDNGAYVEAWVWVDFSDTPLSKEKQ